MICRFRIFYPNRIISARDDWDQQDNNLCTITCKQDVQIFIVHKRTCWVISACVMTPDANWSVQMRLCDAAGYRTTTRSFLVQSYLVQQDYKLCAQDNVVCEEDNNLFSKSCLNIHCECCEPSDWRKNLVCSRMIFCILNSPTCESSWNEAL